MAPGQTHVIPGIGGENSRVVRGSGYFAPPFPFFAFLLSRALQTDQGGSNQENRDHQESPKSPMKQEFPLPSCCRVSSSKGPSSYPAPPVEVCQKNQTKNHSKKEPPFFGHWVLLTFVVGGVGSFVPVAAFVAALLPTSGPAERGCDEPPWERPGEKQTNKKKNAKKKKQKFFTKFL